MANFCMVFSLVAVLSLCFYDPPDPRDFRNWNQRQALLSVVYSLGLIGFVYGANVYSDTDFIDLVLGVESEQTTLWWSMNGAFLTSVVFYGSWRIGLIQGGADVKALILVTLCSPRGHSYQIRCTPWRRIRYSECPHPWSSSHGPLLHFW